MDATGRNMVGLTTEEAREQLAGAQIAGYGCLLFIALALGIVCWAVCAYYQHKEDEAVAAYSICEMCGLVLDATNAHAVCIGEPGAVAMETRTWEGVHE